MLRRGQVRPAYSLVLVAAGEADDFTGSMRTNVLSFMKE